MAATRRKGDGPDRRTQTSPTPHRTSDPESLTVYLQEAGRVPLLDCKLEAELAEELARSRQTLRCLAEELRDRWPRKTIQGIGNWPEADEVWPLEAVDRFVEDVEQALESRRDSRTASLLSRVEQHKRRLDRSRERLLVANLRLVVHIAKKYPHPGVSLPDRVQEGNLGLMRAVDKFDHTRGNRFTTYAFWWIKQAVERAVGNQARTVRVPVHVQEKIRKIRRSSERLRARRSGEPTVAEIARDLGLTPTQVRDAMRSERAAEPLEDSERVLDHLSRAPDPEAPCPYERTLTGHRRRRVKAALDTLPRQERQVIRLRFGLDSDTSLTLDAVGRSIGLSRERVRQIEQRALIRLAASPLCRNLLP